MIQDLRAAAADLSRLLGLRSPPVAIAFTDSAPAGLQRFAKPAPASCSYWRAAAEGQAFYTEEADHQGCPIGAHTHGVPLSEAKQGELMGLVEQMIGLGYLTMEDVQETPSRKAPLRFAVYAPLEHSPVAPDLVLVRGNARALMLLTEAAHRAGIDGPTMSRPTCSVIPQTLATGKTSSSLACVGNRVYTGLPDDEAYCALPGQKLGEIVEALRTVAAANDALEKFHRARA